MTHSVTQIDNGIFRVIRWTITPGDAIPLHVHEHDYVVVPLVSDTMYVVNSDGTEIAAEIRAGESYTRPAGARHTVQNRGSTNDIVFVEIEKLG